MARRKSKPAMTQKVIESLRTLMAELPLSSRHDDTKDGIDWIGRTLSWLDDPEVQQNISTRRLRVTASKRKTAKN